MKLLLTSAGITNDEIAQAVERLAGKKFSELKILFVTTAANTSTEDKTWLTENIFEFTSRKPLSFDLLDIAGLPAELWQRHFKQADIICVGGGDETYLSRIIVEQNVKDFLLSLLNEKVYVGISAGSMVAGKFLPKGLNVELYGEECEGDSGVGMELFNFMFVPHLNSPYFLGVTSEILNEKSDRFDSRVIATDDFTAVSVVDGEVSFIGTGDRWELVK